jgi:hypothetical protein
VIGFDFQTANASPALLFVSARAAPVFPLSFFPLAVARGAERRVALP